MVGVHSDRVVEGYKRKPVFSENDRYYLVRSCKFVDEVYEDAPLVITDELLDEIGADIVVVATEKGAHVVDAYHEVAAARGILNFLPRTEGLSTTHIIRKVVREYRDEALRCMEKIQ